MGFCDRGGVGDAESRRMGGGLGKSGSGRGREFGSSGFGCAGRREGEGHERFANGAMLAFTADFRFIDANGEQNRGFCEQKSRNGADSAISARFPAGFAGSTRPRCGIPGTRLHQQDFAKFTGFGRDPVKSVAVVGGGVSGLAAAYKLKTNGLKVTLFDVQDRAGGKIKSTSEDGFIWDEGANTMTESESAVGRLLDDLGLREKQQFPISQNKRYVVRSGMPQLIPSNPVALIKSNILSTQSKLKILLEPLSWWHSDKRSSIKVCDTGIEESVGQFFKRHFGTEVVDYLIDPFVAGTSASDPESLSMRHAFPQLWNLEKKFGSVIVGAIRSKASGKPKDNVTSRSSSDKKKQQRGSFSFHGGMQTLTNILSCKVGGESLRLNSKVLSLSYDSVGDSPCNGWSISYAANHANDSDLMKSQVFDAVIMTAPLCDVQEMKFKERGNPFNLDFLPKVNYVPVSVMITAFQKECVRRPLEGFGVLVPSKEQENGLKTLGTLFSSMMFPDRAPKNQYLYTTFVGGSRNRSLAGASLNEIQEVVTADLRKLLGVEGQPTFMRHIYWKKAFPLYGLDYDLVLEAIEKLEKKLPGFFYAGNNKDGLSVDKCLYSGLKAAERVISYLNIGNEQEF